MASALALLAISIDVNLSPRLERGNWRDVARALRDAPATRAITTVELGSAPLEYYLPSLRGLHEGTSVKLTEIDETGYAPLRTSAGQPPAPGFRLRARLDIDGLVVYRFVSTVPRMVSEATLRDHVITLAPPHVLTPAPRRSWIAALAAGNHCAGKRVLMVGSSAHNCRLQAKRFRFPICRS